MLPIDIIEDWHVHVYYDADSKSTAEALRLDIEAMPPGLTIGRMHDKPVGPHPMGSFQVIVPNERFAEMASWLALNRRKLTVLLHPNTSDDLKDHRDFPMWYGSMPKIGYEMFDK